MKRQSLGKLILKGIGFVVFGNVLCLVMTLGIFVLGGNIFIKILAAAFAFLIFFSLMFTEGWQDGVRERKLTAHQPDLPERKYAHIAVGIVMFLAAAAPSIFLLVNKLCFPQSDNLIIYQFISGSAYPFVIAFVPTPESADISRVELMPGFLPVLMIVYYALIPVFTQLGFYLAYRGKLSADKIIYK